MKKRIALVVNSLSGGGAERTVSNLSIGLSKKYNVDIIVNDKEHLDYPHRGRIVSLNMPLSMERMGVFYQVLLLFKRTVVLRLLKKKNRYAAVISFSEMCNAANVLSGNRYSKSIISVRNAVRKRTGGGLKRKLVLAIVFPYVCGKADLAVSCSKEIADELIYDFGLRPEKSRVIYNGLNLKRIKERATEPVPLKEKFHGKKLIVTIGRLTPQKGHKYLLHAVKALANEGILFLLVILGDGELRADLELEISKLGLSEYVSMPGFVENPYAYMENADVVVMPSLYEGFSNVIIEALACGAPVVSTDHETGAREILAPDTDYKVKTTGQMALGKYGILVPVPTEFGDDGELSAEEKIMAETIKRILTDSELKDHYRQLSAERAEQLNIRSICEEWIRVIEEGQI